MALASAWSIRYSFLRPCPGTRLPERSSRGVQPSFMVCPEVPAHRLSTGGTSHGVPTSLQRIRWRESTSGRSSCDSRSSFPGVTGVVRRWVPTHQLRCRSQVFPTSQRPSSSPRRSAIFRRMALLGFSLQGFVPHAEASPARRRRPTLMTLFPRIARAPVLGGGTRGRAGRCLGCSATAPFVVFRVFVLA